jgi:pyruvate,water dikinase
MHKNSKTAELTGEEAAKKWYQIHNFDVSGITDLQGIGACKGKAVGEVFIALSASEALKIKPGNILVTGMTMPDYVPAIKKAAAIVTDEGGSTCHAAVISRELGIPCIVGTKYATRFLKNGQRVEVAASHGTVRLI